MSASAPTADDPHQEARLAADLPDLTQVPEADRDRVWYETYYQGDRMPQLTARAVLMGMALGGVMALSNLYVGLKTGWGLGVAITSCILSYAIWNILLSLGLAKTEMSVLENNCMQSTASSAGYSTGGTMVSAIGAYLMITGENMPFWVLFFWTAFLALLGVSVAIPMKRQMINQEQLKFPSGIAAAETLRSLHAAGGEAMRKANALFRTLVAGLGIKWLIEGQPALLAKLGITSGLPSYAYIPGQWGLPFSIRGRAAESYGLAMPIDPIMMAAGAIVGLRTSVSLAFGAVILYGFLGPFLDSQGVFEEMYIKQAISSAEPTAGNIRKWGLWTGSAMMVTAGLTSFALQWRSILRALGGMGAIFAGPGVRSEMDDKLAAIEVPTSWFAIGTGVSAAGCVFIMWYEWAIHPGWGLVSVAFAFVLSLVACRATGETDITPIGAMGKVTQLFYGAMIPQNATANLMTAGVTAGAAGSAADLLTDLKSGYLLGANPRQQTVAQMMGIISGTLIVVPVWYILIPDASAIGNERFPAPAAEVWASVARLLAQGFDSLHPTIVIGMAIGGLFGVVMTLLEAFVPEVKRWMPSATGLGLAFVIGFSDSIAFLIGAVFTEIMERRDRAWADELIVPLASGLIAGESLMGIGIALLMAFGVLG
jgi:uncharacterized oligopeptide transporter (OPT) family protein